MDNVELYNDLVDIKHNDGRSLKLVKFDGEYLVCWHNYRSDATNHNICGFYDVRDFEIEELKSAGIWNKIPEKIQKELSGELKKEQEELQEKMDALREARKDRFPGFPEEVACIQCGKTQKINKTVLRNKIDKSMGALNIEKYIAGFKCQNCRPFKRGKKPSLEFVGLPKKLVCKCGNEVPLNPSFLKKKAEKFNTTMKYLIDNYVCQACKPTKGRHKKT